MKLQTYFPNPFWGLERADVLYQPLKFVYFWQQLPVVVFFIVLLMCQPVGCSSATDF